MAGVSATGPIKESKSVQSPSTSQAWAAVRSQLDACRRQLRACDEAARQIGWQDGHPDAEDEYQAACDWLGNLIYGAHLRLLLLMEQLELRFFLKEYCAEFDKYREKLPNVERVREDPELPESPALDFVSSSFRTLAASLEPVASQKGIDAITLVEGILRDVPHIVTRAKLEPSAERDIQQALFDYLRIVFPSTRREVPIPHVIKTFKADIGIDEIGVLIEIKFADCESEVRSELAGFFEDMHGYKGDPNWNTFFALAYTTAPLLTPRELEAEFVLSGAPIDWKPLVVHGPGSRPSKAPSLPDPLQPSD